MTEIDDFRMVPPDISWKPIKSKLVKVKEFPLCIDEAPIIEENKMLTSDVRNKIYRESYAKIETSMKLISKIIEPFDESVVPEEFRDEYYRLLGIEECLGDSLMEFDEIFKRL